MYYFRFENLWLLFIFIPIFFIVLLWRLKLYKSIIYRFTLVEFFDKKRLNLSATRYKKLFFCIRFFILAILIVLIAKPQFGDINSKLHVNGIDIMLVMDVSGSMLCFDDINDRKTRIDIAKEEAISFLNKRENDPIGLVFFGRWALSRVPLTLDKKILIDVINELKIGEIDHNETVISLALSNAINRLKNSKSKSKIIILVTDGEPTQSDLPIDLPISIAKKLGIKIYTIGIGSEHGGLTTHPFFGVVPVGAKLNKELLIKIAQETGGKFFYSSKKSDMAEIYKTIDALEKTEYETNVFHRYYNFFIPLIFVLLVFVFIEQFLATFVWFYI